MGLFKSIGKIAKKAFGVVKKVDPTGLTSFFGDVLGIAGDKKIAQKNIQSVQDTNAQNLQYQREVNEQNLRIHNETMAAQKEANQNSILWKVQDAARSGVHPLYALGVQPASGGASGVSLVAPQSSAPIDTRQTFGQDISRAASKLLTKRQRVDAVVAARQAAMQEESNLLDLEHKRLSNVYLQSQINRANTPTQAGPPAPDMTPSAKVGTVVSKPSTPIVGSPGNPAKQPGAITEYRFSRTPQGGLAVVPSEDAKQAMEDSAVLEVPWALRNMIAPNLGAFPKPNPREYPTGVKGKPNWRWSVWHQQYVPSE